MNDASPFKVVGLDADDTLWPTQHLYKTVLQTTAARYPDLDHETLLERHAANIEMFGYGALTFGRTLLESVSATTTEHSDLLNAIKLALEDSARIHEDSARPFDGVQQALADMKKTGLRLVFISKGSNAEQLSKLTKSGLGGWFDVVMVLPQKNAAQLSVIVDSLGVAPSEFVMVGNSLSSDVLPSIEIGAAGVLIRDMDGRYQTEGLDVPNGLPIIDGLHQLPSLLENWSNNNVGATVMPSEAAPIKIVPEVEVKSESSLHPNLKPPHRNVDPNVVTLKGVWRKNEELSGWEVQLENGPYQIGSRHEADVSRSTGQKSRRLIEIRGDGNVGWAINETGEAGLL